MSSKEGELPAHISPDWRMLYFSYKCADRRYYVRERGTAYSPQPYVVGRCGWDSNYSLTPSRLECVVKFCDTTASTPPDTTGKNYNLTWSGLVSVEASLEYPCADDHRLEAEFSTSMSRSDPRNC